MQLGTWLGRSKIIDFIVFSWRSRKMNARACRNHHLAQNHSGNSFLNTRNARTIWNTTKNEKQWSMMCQRRPVKWWIFQNQGLSLPIWPGRFRDHHGESPVTSWPREITILAKTWKFLNFFSFLKNSVKTSSNLAPRWLADPHYFETKMSSYQGWSPDLFYVSRIDRFLAL